MKTILLVTALAAFGLLPHAVHAQNYSYAGPYKGTDNLLTSEDLQRDVAAASKFLNEKFPGKFVTVFGSSRMGVARYEAGIPQDVVLENRALYKDVYDFALAWQKKHGAKFPILTGAGPGIMQAASEGAKDSGVGKSIGYTTYYGTARDNGGTPDKAFVTGENGKQIIDDGLIFSSVTLREFFMIVHSKAMVFLPGGTGTEWEIFQTLEMIKSGQLDPLPVILVGNKEKNWSSLYARWRDFHGRAMIRENEVTDLIIHVEKASEVIPILEKKLALE